VGGSNNQTALSTLDYSGVDGTFEVDGTLVTLDANYADEAALATAIEGQLTGYTVAVVGGTAGGGDLEISITNDTSPTAVAITNANAAAIAGGFADSAGTAGTETSNLVFDVDGTTVTINSDYTGDIDGLVADIQGQIGAGYVVAAEDADTFSITSATTGANTAVVDNFQTTSITGADGGTQVDGVDDTAALSLTVSELTVQVGDGTAVAVANATYDSVDDFVAAINTALGGNATASLDDNNVLTISSSETITIGGADAATVFTATEFAASGSLTTVNVNSVDAANDAIRRIDSALTSVSDLRSTFGAIQNRFESTIANLGSTVENLSASRSRILDADFAAETANLTRAQILQQAGISILSQANALPQTVLGLLG
jgi:flagellin